MAKIYGQLEKAQVENVSADPTAGKAGRLVWNYTDAKFRIDNGTNFKEVTVNDQTQTLTNKTIDADSNTITNIENADIKAGAAIAHSKMAALTASRAMVTDGSGVASASAVTATELGYVSGVTSAIQTQLNTGSSNLTTHESDTSTHGVTGDIVGTTDSQVLTNKKIGLDDGATGAGNLALYFDDDTNTGLYSSAADAINVEAGGYQALEMKKSTGNYANIGVGGASASASDSYPLLIERTVAGMLVAQISNPSSDATASAKIQLSTDAGDKKGELAVFPNESAVDAYAGRFVVRPNENATGLSLIGGDLATGNIKAYTAGDYTSAGEAFRINEDKTVQFPNAASGVVAPSSGVKLYAKSDGKLYKYSSTDGAEVEVGAGAGGGTVNHISSNPDAESGTTGWAAYSDAAGTSPVDATGGAPTVTWTRTTTNPLRNTGSFLLTKDAANRQGEGASFAFTPSRADRYKVHTISFNYEVASGTYTDDAVRVFVYDVTNSTVIEPAPNKIKNTSVNGEFSCSFQTTDSTSYRLCFHVAGTDTSAYTIKFDDLAVSPVSRTYGPYVGDWTAVTVTGGWSSNTSYTAYEKRVGDTAHYRVYVALTGAPTSANMTINLPSGRSVDTAKISSVIGDSIPHVGHGMARDDSANSTISLKVGMNTSTQMILFYEDDAAAGLENANIVTQAAPFTFASGDGIHVEFSVPISGWSSSQLLASETDTRVCAARFTSTDTTAVASSASGTFVWNGTSYDTHGAKSGNTYVVQVPGKYRVSGQITLASAAWTAGTYAYATVLKNATNQNYSYTFAQASASYLGFIRFDTTVDCVAGDVLKVDWAHNSGANKAPTGTATENFVMFERLTGPSQIAASETVAVGAKTSAGQTIETGAGEIIIFGTEEFDTHGAYDATTGIFTAPVSGLYDVQAQLLFTTGAWADGNYCDLAIRVDGSNVKVSENVLGATTSANFWLDKQVKGRVRLLAGQTVSIYVAHNRTAGALALYNGAGFNYMSIVKVGNY